MQLAEGQCVLAVTHYLRACVCECACVCNGCGVLCQECGAGWMEISVVNWLCLRIVCTVIGCKHTGLEDRPDQTHPEHDVSASKVEVCLVCTCLVLSVFSSACVSVQRQAGLKCSI